MGCDIHSFVEVKEKDSTEWILSTDEVFSLDDFDKRYLKKEKSAYPFTNRSYSIFGFLADVRNYSAVNGFECKHELPPDCSQGVLEAYESWELDAHSCSYLSAKELIEFNYDAECIDRRVTREVAPNCFNGAVTGTEEEGKKETFKEFLGSFFMEHIEGFKELVSKYEDVRFVFWFDN